MSVLLIGVTCVAMNLLLCSSGVYYMDTVSYTHLDVYKRQALSRDVVHIDLVGSANAPAVVVTQNDTAVVLFRGGNSVRNAVAEQLYLIHI